MAAQEIDPDDDHFDWPPPQFFESRGIPDPLNPGHEPSGPRGLPDVARRLLDISLAFADHEGYLPLAAPLARLRDADGELSAWHARTVIIRGRELARALAPGFGLTDPAANLLGAALSTAENQVLDAQSSGTARRDRGELVEAIVAGLSTTLMTVTARISQRPADDEVRRALRRIRR